MEGERWEYCFVDLVISNYRNSGNQMHDWIDNLNQLGQDGWEAIADTTIHAQGWSQNRWPILLMKRRARQEA